MSVVAWDGRGWFERHRRNITEEYKETTGSDGFVSHPHCWDSSVDVNIG